MERRIARKQQVSLLFPDLTSGDATPVIKKVPFSKKPRDASRRLDLFESKNGHCKMKVSKHLFGGDFSVLRQKWRSTNLKSKGKWISLSRFASEICESGRRKEIKEKEKLQALALQSREKGFTKREAEFLQRDPLFKNLDPALVVPDSVRNEMKGRKDGYFLPSGEYVKPQGYLESVSSVPGPSRTHERVTIPRPTRRLSDPTVVVASGSAEPTTMSEVRECICSSRKGLNTGIYAKVKVRNGFLVRCKTCRKLYRVDASGDERGNLFEA
jgi:hypothetical protein